MYNSSMYFQYTLKDLQERSSSKKEFSYITFFAVMVVHRVHINSQVVMFDT